MNSKNLFKNMILKTVEAITGVSKELIIKAAMMYASTKPASILYSLGITEHTHGTENVFALGNLSTVNWKYGKAIHWC